MTSALIFKGIGALGLVFITIGVLTKKRLKEDVLFIIGGLLLEVYAIYLKDIIYIPLQLIFVAASVYGVYEIEKRKNGANRQKAPRSLKAHEESRDKG